MSGAPLSDVMAGIAGGVRETQAELDTLYIRETEVTLTGILSVDRGAAVITPLDRVRAALHGSAPAFGSVLSITIGGVEARRHGG